MAYTQMYYVDLPDQFSFLKSTANNVKAFSRCKDIGKNGKYEGGGIQLYSPEASKKATFSKAAN